jgi:hypothetical protein
MAATAGGEGEMVVLGERQAQRDISAVGAVGDGLRVDRVELAEIQLLSRRVCRIGWQDEQAPEMAFQAIPRWGGSGED